MLAGLQVQGHGLREAETQTGGTKHFRTANLIEEVALASHVAIAVSKVHATTAHQKGLNESIFLEDFTIIQFQLQAQVNHAVAHLEIIAGPVAREPKRFVVAQQANVKRRREVTGDVSTAPNPELFRRTEVPKISTHVSTVLL